MSYTLTDLYNALQAYKTYTQTQFPFKATIYSGTADPTIGSGFVANVGSFYILLNGSNVVQKVLIKADTPNTAWILFGDGFTNPMTTAGDFIVAGVAGIPQRLGVGADNYVLKVDPITHLPSWAPAGQSGTALTPITFDTNQIANGTLSVGNTEFSIATSANGVALGQTTLATPYQFELRVTALGASPQFCVGLIHSSYQAADAATDFASTFSFATYAQFFSGTWTLINGNITNTITNWTALAASNIFTIQYDPSVRTYVFMQNGVVATFGGSNIISGDYDIKPLFAVTSSGTTTVAGNFAGPFAHGTYPATVLNVDTDNDPIAISGTGTGGDLGTLQAGINYQLAYGCAFDTFFALPSSPVQGQWVNVKKTDTNTTTLTVNGNGQTINGNSNIILANVGNFANLFYDVNYGGWYTVSQFIGAPSAATQPVSVSKTVGISGDFPNMSSALTWHGNQVWGHGATATYTWQSGHTFTYLDAIQLVGNDFSNAKIATVDNSTIVDSSCSSMTQFGIPAFINLFNSKINVTGTYSISGVQTIASIVSAASTLGIQTLSDHLSISGSNYQSVFYFTTIETVLTLGDSVGFIAESSSFDQTVSTQGPITLYSTPNTVVNLIGNATFALLGDCGSLSIAPSTYTMSIGTAGAKADVLINAASPNITPASAYAYFTVGQGSNCSIRTLATDTINFNSTAASNLFAIVGDGSTLTIRSPMTVSGTIPNYLFGVVSEGQILNNGSTGLIQGTHYNNNEYVSVSGVLPNLSVPAPVNTPAALIFDAAWGRTLVDTTTTDSSVIVIPEDVGTYELNVAATTMTFELINFVKWDKQQITILLKQGLTNVNFTINGSPTTPIGLFSKTANSIVKLEYSAILSAFSVSSVPVMVSTTLTFNPQAGDYGFVLSDSLNNSVMVQGTDSNPHTYTIPLNASVAFPVGCQIHVFQSGTGTITIAGALGVTVESPASLQTRSQYSTIVLMKLATDTWAITGDIA